MEKEPEKGADGDTQSLQMKKKPRKKVPTKKRWKRAKERGKYVSQSKKQIGLGDPDLIECIFSDDEERAEILKTTQPTSVEPDNLEIPVSVEAPSTSGLLSPTPSIASSSTAHSGMEYGSASDSRASSAFSFSRPDSALECFSPEERPESSTSTSRPVSSIPPFTPCTTGGLNMQSSYARPSSASGFSDASSASAQTGPFSPVSGVGEEQETSPNYCPPISGIESALLKFRSVLPSPWKAIADKTGFHVLLLSQGSQKAIQRQIFSSYEGVETISVHCKPLSFAQDILNSVSSPSVVLKEGFVERYCDRAVGVCRALMQYNICVGANHEDSKEMWWAVPNTYIDRNPYHEKSYVETCRSFSCLGLVEMGKRTRCISCAAVMKSLRKKESFLLSDTIPRNTPNIFLTHKQALDKLQQQSEEIRRKDKKIAYLTQRIHDVLDAEGVDVDSEMNNDLAEVLANSELSPTQKILLEEQVKCAGKADPRAHRWHPAMIRLALYLKMVSSSAYDALRDSGMVKLPSRATLYDYTRPYNPQEGISQGLLKTVSEKILKFNHSHEKYVALLCDEMHVSKNLVYRQADGNLVGYTHLDEVDKEILQFEKYVSGQESVGGVQLANKVLAFMVKGLASDVKYVIAAYPCNQLTKDLLYVRAWDVISQLERAHIKVLAFVCDGSAVNRSFIGMHKPITENQSGIVFDTLNFCSPERRPLYFIADVAHLLKTIRNCFYNSGEGEKKPRCLELNGQKILWKTVIRLYLTYKQCNFRKSYKLNAQNVFPNSYSCMKVRFAAEVLSDTVALDIEQQRWTDTSETVKFIRLCNKFFDCLNGSHSSQHIKTRNPNLAPYTELDDPRYEWLQSFLNYLDDWKKQVEALKISQTEKAKKNAESSNLRRH